MAHDESIGTCDLCGKEADANFETCHALFCTANCHREQGDIYHADCLKKFIAQGSKGTAKHLPSIPYSNFPCPKGKGRGSQPDVPCKGLAHHCKRVIFKSEPKAPLPQVVLEKRPKPLPKPKPPAPPKPAKPKAPPVSDFNPRAVRLPPVPAEPKADPLGRNLNGTPQAELPPGFVDAEAEAAKARQGRAAKKNQKKRAKRKEDSEQEGWDAASASGSNADPHAAADGLQAWDSAAASSAAGDGAGAEGSSAGGGRFITSISAFNALLSKHLDMSDDSEYDYESDDDGSVSTAHRSDATPTPRWDHHQQQQPPQQQRQQDAGDATGWQAVDGKGRALPPAALPAGAGARAQHGTAQPAAEDPAELRRREEQLLKEALEASMRDAAEAGVTPAVDEEALIARAMQESLAAEQAQQQREMEEQAELLARFEAQRLQQQGAQALSGGWSAGADADADAWGSAGSADSSATAWALSQQPVSPYHQPVQQQTGYLPNPYAAAPAAPAAAAAPAPAPAPHATAYITLKLPQPVYAASATPAPLAATMSAPYAAPATATAAPAAPPAPPEAYQPAALQQQQQAAALQQQMPWLQPAAANSTAALGGYAGTGAYASAGGYQGGGVDYKAAPVAPVAAAAADDDEDDLDSLLALLNV